MTVNHPIRLCKDADFELAVTWLRDDVPVDVEESSLVVTRDGIALLTLTAFTQGVDGTIVVTTDMASLATIAEGPADYTWVLKQTGGGRVRMLEGDVVVDNGAAV